MAEPVKIHLCPRCLLPAEGPGACSNCGAEVVRCRPGDPDDPCRRPVMDRQGNVRTRAPLWWLRARLGELARYYIEDSS